MLRPSIACLLAVLPVPAAAQSPVDVMLKPAEDVNLRRREVPPLLAAAVDAPYSNDATASCTRLAAAITALDEVLGPDFDAGAPVRTGLTAGRVAERVVASIVPFRGVVREVSGAADAKRRYDAAVDAGIARRGYLRGIARAKGCKARRVKTGG